MPKEGKGDDTNVGATPSDAAISFGKFLAPLVRRTVAEAIGIVEDHFRVVRWERQQRLMNRTEDFREQHGIKEPFRAVPLNVAIPLIQAGSLEEDDELQDLWARLLVNATDASSSAEVRRTFVSILENFTKLDAAVMASLYNVQPDLRGHTFLSGGLPSEAVQYSRGAPLSLPPEDVQESLWNLQRLGCITFDTALADGASKAMLVSLTPLGMALMRACTL